MGRGRGLQRLRLRWAGATRGAHWRAERGCTCKPRPGGSPGASGNATALTTSLWKRDHGRQESQPLGAGEVLVKAVPRSLGGRRGSGRASLSTTELLCAPAGVATAAGRPTGSSDSVPLGVSEGPALWRGVTKGKREASGSSPRTANEGGPPPQAEARTAPEAQEALKELV